jgi:hypothetical protein
MAEKNPKKQRLTPEGKALLKEALEHKELIEETEESYRELEEGRAVFYRWQDVKRSLDEKRSAGDV